MPRRGGQCRKGKIPNANNSSYTNETVRGKNNSAAVFHPADAQKDSTEGQNQLLGVTEKGLDDVAPCFWRGVRTFVQRTSMA